MHVLSASILAAVMMGGTTAAAAGVAPDNANSSGFSSTSAMTGSVSQQARAADETKDKAQSEDQAETDKTVNLKAVTVVSSVGSNIAGIAPVGVETTKLDLDDIRKTGGLSVNDVLHTLPQVSDISPAGLDNMRQGGTAGYGSANGGGNATQGTTVNLRGLGPHATLVLIDGHRVTPTGASSQFVDINQVPVAALRGVEVLTGGGSAVYGSDAIAGVVNLQIRKDFDGLEVTPRATWSNGHNSRGISAILGHTWSSLGSLGQGNFMVTVDYSHRDAMLRSASPYLLDDLTRFGGVNNIIRGSAITTGAINGGVGPGQPGQAGSPGGGSGPIATPGATSNIAWCDTYVAGACVSGTYLYRALPLNKTATSYADTSAQPSMVDRAGTTDFLGRENTHRFDIFYNQDITENLSVDFSGFWTHRDTLSVQNSYYSSVPVVTVNPGSPYYIAPPGSAGGPMTVDLSPSALGLPSFTTSNTDLNWTSILGVHAKLGGDWRMDISMTYGEDHACGECQSELLGVGALQYAVYTGKINPLSTSKLTPEQLGMIVGRNVQMSDMTFQDDVVKFNGTLFDLPAGPLKAAIGAEYMRSTQLITNGASRTNEPAFGIVESSALPPVGFEGIGCSAPLPCPPRTQPNEFAYDNIDRSERNTHSAFVELYVPIVSKEQDIPLVRSLVFDVAERYDHYSGIGSTANPKISFSWGLSRDVSIQGSWGKSFVAPNLAQSNPFVFSYKGYAGGFPNLTGDPSISGSTPGLVNTAFVFGNREGLKPETARTWSLGATVTPHAIPHLLVGATYHHIRFENLIFAVNSYPAALLSPSGLEQFRPFVHPVHNPSTCSATNPDYDPALLPYVDAVGIYGAVTPAQLCQVDVWVDGRNANVGSMTQDGVDFNGNYMLVAGSNTWMFNLSATKVISQKLGLIPGEPGSSILGSMVNGGLVPWRGRVSLGWMKGPVSATLFGNYVGVYRNDNPLSGLPESDVPSWTTFGLNATLYLGGLSAPEWLAGSNVSLHVSNLFDRDPPTVLTAGGAAFDASRANVFGRTISLRFTYRAF